MRVRYCCTISCEVVRPDFIAASRSAMLASKTLNAALVLVVRPPGAGACPATRNSSAMTLTVDFMASDLVTSNEPENNPDQFSLRLLQMRGVVGAGNHDPGLVGRAEPREELRRDRQRRLRIVVAV